MADRIQIILKEDVPNLGRSGELVAVKPGYGRNYLIPQGLAIIATQKNIARLDHEKKVIELRSAKRRKDAEGLKSRLEKVTLHIERQVGEGDKLFGSVTSRDVEEALAAQGVPIDRKKIVLVDPIKALGQYTVDVKLGPDMTGQVKVWVVAKS